MKVLISGFLILFFTTACGEHSKHAFYDILHESERQKCLREGQKDCPRETIYEAYKKDREEAIQYDKYGNPK